MERYLDYKQQGTVDPWIPPGLEMARKNTHRYNRRDSGYTSVCASLKTVQAGGGNWRFTPSLRPSSLPPAAGCVAWGGPG